MSGDDDDLILSDGSDDNVATVVGIDDDIFDVVEGRPISFTDRQLETVFIAAATLAQIRASRYRARNLAGGAAGGAAARAAAKARMAGPVAACLTHL